MAYGKMKRNLIEKTELTINRFSFQAGNLINSSAPTHTHTHTHTEKMDQSNVRLSIFHKVKVTNSSKPLRIVFVCVEPGLLFYFI